MTENIYAVRSGDIHYLTGAKRGGITLVFLPGLTADHRLFDRQLEYFEDKYPVLVWDAPGHAASWPFRLDFSLEEKAEWLGGILEREAIDEPVMIGQSMGGYVAQAFMQRFPGRLKGFVSIDSAPLQRRYTSKADIWLLKRMEPFYRLYPWRALVKDGSEGCAVSEYGRELMRKIIMVYDGDKERYAKLAGHGFRIIAEAIEADLPYEIDCPALLICGEKDRAGYTKRYNREWHRISGIPLEWIKDAGHNSNTDQPELVNELIEKFVQTLNIA